MSHAERTHELLAAERIGALSTHSVKHPGFPFGSMMPYALIDDGSPIFLISGMAVHTHNLTADPRASLLVMQSGGDARATLIGHATRVVNAPDSYAQLYLDRHPSAQQWIGFGDFSFFRLDLLHVYFVGGFGSMGWVTADDFRNTRRTSDGTNRRNSTA
jgi:heme iron utilization protein